MSSLTALANTEVRGQEGVRAVTDLEVAFFQENGWVLMPNLLTTHLCAAMLERGQPKLAGALGSGGATFDNLQQKLAHMRVSGTDEGTVTDNAKWVEWRGAVRIAQDEMFCRAALASTMGFNVQRLLGRSKPIRVYHDIFMCKLPDEASTKTGWHQDSPNFPLDRNALTVWIALDEITVDQGSLQFYSGSHRCGLLGKNAPDPALDLLDEYPEVARFPLSPPHHLKPGDATVHHGLTVHGAGANYTHRPRWSYAVAYFPSDARYTGAPNHDCDGFDLKPGQPIEHPSFSMVAD
ncbi:MAG: phytanoyl-CoA dioxygenase family protein [Acidimicrobiaceae bacterium]|nr:phytanoyl-CoA dioxygenase family protein [Acidimicrobiaceae bacterium]